MVECCENCKYGQWKIYCDEHHKYCECHRHAPEFAEPFMRKFPLMRNDDYCGDWEEVKEDGEKD